MLRGRVTTCYRIPMATKTTSPIEHIVVLMLENRSFDHMLGYLPREGHLAELEGLTGKEFNLFDPFNPDSEKVFVKPGALYEWEGVIPGSGPAHNFLAANQQLTGSEDGPSAGHRALNNGFVQSFIDSFRSDRWNDGDAAIPTHEQYGAVMHCFTPDQVPAISSLAQEFVVCDHWFSSVPGPTMPNRLYVHAATSAGFAHNEWDHNWHFETVYNRLADAGYEWAIYYANDDVATHFTAVKHDKHQLRHYEEKFAADVSSGKLPHYSFIIPRFIDWNGGGTGFAAANSQHAPSDVRPGEVLIAEVYESLRNNEKAWKSTLLIVVYDEHGGFYDHVIPPAGVPNPDCLNSPTPAQIDAAKKAKKTVPAPFDFTRLGFRVPAILVSPWLPKMLDSTQYEHASIAATLNKFFGLGDFLTARDAAANSFEHLLTGDGGFRDDTPDKLPLPSLPTFEDAALRVPRGLDSIQRDIMQGTITKIADIKRRTDLLERLAKGKMAQQEASEIMIEVLEGFQELVTNSGGRHPDADDESGRR